MNLAKGLSILFIFLKNQLFLMYISYAHVSALYFKKLEGVCNIWSTCEFSIFSQNVKQFCAIDFFSKRFILF